LTNLPVKIIVLRHFGIATDHWVRIFAKLHLTFTKILRKHALSLAALKQW